MPSLSSSEILVITVSSDELLMILYESVIPSTFSKALAEGKVRVFTGVKLILKLTCSGVDTAPLPFKEVISLV